MIEMKKKLFTLSRRNQKGQVAIFVALIFQVIFIFFAVLINVGLLVHHKINLQQSTDLAAYYGAMKQAELMNAIAHVNFQMRQAWKLLTWRYRIVGTFGLQNPKTIREAEIKFPLRVDVAGSAATRYQSDAEVTKCPSTGVNILDVPFFCGGHSGFGTWRATNENNCRIDCAHLNDSFSLIDPIPLTGGFDTRYSGGVAGAVNQALTQANNQIANLCDDLGPSGFASMAKYIIAYGAEVQKKKKLIQMLGASLSAAPNVMVDLNGGAVEMGATKTFDNNLTDANLKGKISLSMINGLAQGDGGCAFQGNANDGADANGTAQFLKEIKIQAVQFFIHQCSTGGGPDGKRFLPAPMLKGGSLQQIEDRLFPTSMSAGDRANLTAAIVGTEYIIGYEKNPWCQVYYGAKAQAEPKIPFLPLSKIRLSAISVAKPFGGTIGPRYNAFWPAGNVTSSGGPKVDPTLPERKFSGLPPGSRLVQFQALLPNYANYVGDVKGLKDGLVTASYQEMLLYRNISQNVAGGSLRISENKDPDPAPAVGLQQPPAPNGWPDYGNWNSLVDPSPTNTNYDYLAKSRQGSRNSLLRDLEIAVIAPNQFDLNYYSIDPDFYNNYYLKIVGGSAGPLNFNSSYSKLLSAARGNGPSSVQEINPDYGFSASLEANDIAKGFSVRHQIAVAANVVKSNSNHVAQDFPQENSQTFSFMPDKASSVLTGWTFQDFSHYVDTSGGSFPSVGPDAQNTMTFGKCRDVAWNNTTDTSIENLFDTPVSKSLPPTPGNCVTGGRTGYSVKIVSPAMLRNGAAPQDYGGGGVTGPVANPIDPSFFTF